ncbi:Hypothetical predicted protein [Cloeon dipterum]|uniref:Uncharacterized protein n=1 Tax=Cloeon dipterum TaxID=197152 RepID=A0A8S1CM74_9INSE|nr:Hypothetical predicted protein [Cloeon dipterum]
MQMSGPLLFFVQGHIHQKSSNAESKDSLIIVRNKILLNKDDTVTIVNEMVLGSEIARKIADEIARHLVEPLLRRDWPNDESGKDYLDRS